MASVLAFRARLRLFTPEEGGWRVPAPKRQMCLCDVGNTYKGKPVFHDARITLQEGEELNPGEEALVLIEPLHAELWDNVEAGHPFTVHEGFAAKGRGVVTERFLQGNVH